jgi:hypothetical protein
VTQIEVNVMLCLNEISNSNSFVITVISVITLQKQTNKQTKALLLWTLWKTICIEQSYSPSTSLVVKNYNTTCTATISNFTFSNLKCQRYFKCSKLKIKRKNNIIMIIINIWVMPLFSKQNQNQREIKII